MTQPESSLTLDAVICGRCHAISPADEHTCPYCGADRHGAVFTSVADAAAVIPTEEPYDFVDLRDTGWLTRLARRKMVTSYPSLPEPGDEPVAPVRRPARKLMAVLVSGVVAGVAAGAYFYVQHDAGVVPTKSVSAAGAVGDSAFEAQGHGDVARPTLARRGSAESSGDAQSQPALASANATGDASRSASAAGTLERTQASQDDTATGRVVSQTRSAAVPSANSAPARSAESASASATAHATVSPSTDKTAAASASATAPSATLAQTRTSASASAVATARSTTIASTDKIAATPAAAEAPTTKATAPRSPSQATTAAATASAGPSVSAPTGATMARAAPTAAARSTPSASVLAASVPPWSEPAQLRANATPSASTAPMASLPADRSAPGLAPQPQTATAMPNKSTPATTTATTTARPKDNAPQATASATEPERTTPPAVARNIVAVRQALAARDLSAARRHMRGLYTNQALSPEIQQLAADVTRQERARDSAIANARSCSVNREPACAVRNARRAVALDPRNPQAQTLLRQATAAQAEANTAYFRQASALPAPAQAAMTFDGRWSVAGRHGSATSQQDRSSSTFTIFGLGVPTVSKGRGDAH